MKIVINGMEIFGEDEAHGPQRFGVELVNALDEITAAHEVEIVLPREVVQKRDFSRLKNIDVVGLDYDLSKFKGRFRFSKFEFPRYVKKSGGIGCDLVLSFPLSHCDAVCVFDCIIKEHPEECVTFKSKLFRFKFLTFEKHCVKNAKLVITISEYSKKKIEELYHVPSQNIAVIGCAWQHIQKVEADAAILKHYDLKQKSYYFTAGVGIKRKNFEWIIAAARQNPKYLFVIAGANVKPLLEKLNVNLKNIVSVGYVTDEEYKALVENCKAYIQPSLEEGFGIPPLEAMGVGAEAIISKIPVFEEIYEDAVHYMNPYQYDNINMDKIMSTQTVPAQEILDKYSWKKSAQKLYSSISAICEK